MNKVQEQMGKKGAIQESIEGAEGQLLLNTLNRALAQSPIREGNP